MKKFVKTYEVGAGEGDCFDFCRISSLLNFMQDAATKHSELMGISRHVLVSKYNTIWILARTLICLDEPIRANDILTIETWHRGFQGPIWYRDFIFTVNGKRVGHGTNVWVTADATTHKMKKPEGFEEINTLSAAPELSLEISLGKLKAPEDMVATWEKVVSYSDLDINRHLNNAKYGDLVCDAIKMSELSPCYFSRLQINYNNESLPGEKVILKANSTPSCVVGVTDNGDSKFIAEFILNFA